MLVAFLDAEAFTRLGRDELVMPGGSFIKRLSSANEHGCIRVRRRLIWANGGSAVEEMLLTSGFLQVSFEPFGWVLDGVYLCNGDTDADSISEFLRDLGPWRELAELTRLALLRRHIEN